jgi:hypothetical protein
LPLIAQGLLAVAVVMLGAAVLWAGSGGIGPAVASLAGAFGGAFDRVTATPSPTASAVEPVAGAPLIAAPEEPYTNLDTVDVSVSVPTDVAGRAGFTVRLWVTVPDEPTTLVGQAAVGPTSTVVLAGVPLAAGRNDFQATILSPAGESDPSPVVYWVLDQAPPKVTISSPKDGAAVNGDAVTIQGKTQGRSSIVAHNEANGATATATASEDGTFEAVIPIAAGTNGITVTATDPARNANSIVVTVRRGSGRLTASVAATSYRFSIAKLPISVEFVVTVTDPDGRPLGGATALFTVTVPGLEAIVSSELVTAGDGTAVFRTRIASGAMVGTGLVSVLVTDAQHGTATDRQVLTIVK